MADREAAAGVRLGPTGWPEYLGGRHRAVHTVAPPRRTARPAARQRPIEAIVAAGLFIIGHAVRRRALPGDGLVFDDAWVAIGAGKASIGEMLLVTTLRPGSPVLLKA